MLLQLEGWKMHSENYELIEKAEYNLKILTPGILLF